MKRKFIWWLGFIALYLMYTTAVYGQWPTQRQNYQRNGAAPVSIDPNRVTLDWFYFPSDAIGTLTNASAIGFGTVVYGYLASDLSEKYVALNPADGSVLWTTVTRAAGLGLGAEPSPTIAEIDTGGGVTDTVVFVGGTTRRVLCLDLATGAIIWNTLLPVGSAGIRVSTPLVVDTVVVVQDYGSLASTLKIRGLHVKTGALLWETGNLDGRFYLNLAASNDTVYTATRGQIGATLLSPDSSGTVYMINAHTGAVLGSRHFYDHNFQAGISIIGDHIATVTRSRSAGSHLVIVWDSHDITTAPRTAERADFVNLSSPLTWEDPTSGETLITYSRVSNLIISRKISPGAGISGRAFVPTLGTGEVAGAVAALNGTHFQPDDAGYMYVNDMTGAFGGLHYWHKQFIDPNVAFGAWLTAPSISVDDDTLIFFVDAVGNAFAYRLIAGTRARAETWFDELGTYAPIPEVLMNIIPDNLETGTGGSDDTTLAVFENIGDADLTYSISHESSPMNLNAGDFPSVTSVTLSRTHPARDRMAVKFAEDNAITASDGFHEKKYIKIQRQAPADRMDFLEEEGIADMKDLYGFIKSTSFAVNRFAQAKARASQIGWLFVNDLTAQPVAPGGDVTLRLAAINPDSGYGQYFGEILLFNTNEPDSEGSYLDTNRMIVRLVVGFLGDSASVEAAHAGVTKSNYGDEGVQSPDVNWVFNGIHSLDQVGCFFYLGNDTGNFAGLKNQGATDINSQQAASGFRPDTTMEIVRDTLVDGVFADTVVGDWSYTKWVHTKLPLSIRQFAYAVKDSISPYSGDAVFQTFVIKNTGPVPVTDIELGLDADLDVPDFGTNRIKIDSTHDVVWMYDTVGVADIPIKFGWMRAPRDNVDSLGTAVLTGWINRSIAGSVEYYGNAARDDTIHHAFSIQRKFTTHPKGDYNMTIGAKHFSLNPGESRTETFILWAADTTLGDPNLLNRFKDWLRILGYYRGDTKGDGGTFLDDAVYLVNYVFSGGPDPLPFKGQGDVNDDGAVNLADIQYLLNYIFHGVWGGGSSPAPIDRDRFIAPYSSPRPGLTNDNNWKP